MRGLFDIIINNRKFPFEQKINPYIKGLGYSNIITFIEPNRIKIYCDDKTQFVACTITNDEVKISKRLPGLTRIFREIKIENLTDKR